MSVHFQPADQSFSSEAQTELQNTTAARCVNSRPAVVLAENLRPLLSAVRQPVGHNVPEPLHHSPPGLHKLPQVRVAVSDGGLQSHLKEERQH